MSESNLVQEYGHSADEAIPQILHNRNPNEIFRPFCNYPFGLCIIKDCVVVKNFSSIVLLTSHGRFCIPDASSDEMSFQFREQCVQKEVSYRVERHELPPRVLNDNVFRHFTDITAILKSPKASGSNFINIGDVLFGELSELCSADESSPLYCNETLDESIVHSTSFDSSLSSYEEAVETCQTLEDGTTFLNSLQAEVDSLESEVNRVGDGTAIDDDGTLISTLEDISESNADSSISSSQTSSCDCFSSLSSQMSISDEVARVRIVDLGLEQRVDFRAGKRKCRANIRERKRIRDLNVAFTDLKRSIPKFKYHCKQISQLEILREAVNYIHQLRDLLDGNLLSIPPNGGFTGSRCSRLFRGLANSRVISSEPVVKVNDDYNGMSNNKRTDKLISDSLLPMETNEQLMLPMNVSSSEDVVVDPGSSPVSPASFDCSSFGFYDDLSILFPGDCFVFADGIADEASAFDCGY